MNASVEPRVTFVVPCYKLAHLLRECVDSILAQTYRELEVLILDDCSPDDTPAVAASFKDPRVRHVRNEVNLRHLANYNKGITMARGRYVWLISADDKLRKPYIVERYVGLLDAHPQMTFAFCPAMKFRGATETSLYGSYGERDHIFRGDELLKLLAHGNGVSAPTGLVRKSAYDEAGLFPLDLPFAGDWFMWAAFALRGDVGYFAEPMVSYRDHEMNMTKFYLDRAALLMADEFAVQWRILRQAEAMGREEVAAAFREGLRRGYAQRVVARASDPAGIGLSVDEFEVSLASFAADAELAARIRSGVWADLGDFHYDRGDPIEARRCYQRAIANDPRSVRTQAKLGLLSLGRLGARVRERIVASRSGAKA